LPSHYVTSVRRLKAAGAINSEAAMAPNTSVAM
jgi:hypothetical protein